jgi:hypothetical protein
MLETLVQALAHEVPLLDPVADWLTNFVVAHDGIVVANIMTQAIFDHFIINCSFFC